MHSVCSFQVRKEKNAHPNSTFLKTSWRFYVCCTLVDLRYYFFENAH